MTGLSIALTDAVGGNVVGMATSAPELPLVHPRRLGARVARVNGLLDDCGRAG